MNDVMSLFVQKVAEQLIKQLEAGTAPWQKPWQPGEPGAGLPTNPVTGKRYQGINAVHLMAQGYEDERWMTYRQAQSIGAQVLRGEKGTPIQYWKFSEERTKTDGDDRPVLDAEGNPVKETVRLARPALFMATVFNAQQIDGLPARQARKEPAWKALEQVDSILEASKAKINHWDRDAACYNASADCINLPVKERFASASQYYATALHELGHWTGHESRLNRDMAHPFGSEAYAREELRAEIASMIIGAELGVGHDPGQHAAYVGSWVKALRDDPLEIFRAASGAEEIRSFVRGVADTRKAVQTDWQDDNLAAQAVADFIAANRTLLPSKVALNTRGATPALQALLADEPRMASLDDRVDDLLRGLNATQVAATKFVIGKTLHGSVRDNEGRSWTDVQVLPAVRLRSGEDDAQAVADFIAANMNLIPEKIAENTRNAPEALREILADTGRMAQIDGRVDVLLDRLSQAYVDRVHAVIADTLGRADAAQRAERAAASWAELPRFRVSEADQVQELADFIAANRGLLPEKIAGNVHDAGASLQALLRDEDTLKSLKPKVAMTLAGISEQQIDRAFAIAIEAVARDVPREVMDVRDIPTLHYQEAEMARRAKNAQPPVAGMLHSESAIDDGQAEQKGALQLAQLREQAVRRDPQSTVEDVTSAAEGRREMETSLKQATSDGARRLEEQQRARQIQMDVPKPATTRDEFSAVLRKAGCILDTGDPVIDGEEHLVALGGTPPGEPPRIAAYAVQDGARPYGYVRSPEEGIEIHWRAKGYVLEESARNALNDRAEAALQDRERAELRKHEEAAEATQVRLNGMRPPDAPTPFLKELGLTMTVGVMTDARGLTTCLPMTDAAGKVWSAQFIDENGKTESVPGARKDGCFHTVGGYAALARAPALVIASDYASANTLASGLGFATVAALDTANLPEVAKQLHERFPGKPVLIAADRNVRHKADGQSNAHTFVLDAVKVAGAKLLQPIFAPDERRADGERLSSFADLARESKFGEEAVKRQASQAVEMETGASDAVAAVREKSHRKTHGRRNAVSL